MKIISEIVELLVEQALAKGEHVADNGFSAAEVRDVARELGLNFSLEKFTFAAFHTGINVELEHSNVTHKSPKMTGKIALAHLREDPKYYEKLAKVEGESLTEAPVRRRMDIPLPSDLLQIGQMFKAAGKQFYLVGGSVRDALLGKDPKDFDLATDAVPDDIDAILRRNPNYKILEVGKAFGVVKVITDQGNEYEIATFRQDIGKGRRPDAVAFSTIDQDVARRDLTMNALFYDIENREIVDYVGGIDDIENGIVRTVGAPHERFDEDRLRILRALRFAGRLGSGLDPAMADAIRQNNSLAGVSGERIRDEFLKGIKSAKSVPQFLSLISEFDLWGQIFPGLRVNRNFIASKSIPVQLAALLRDNEWKSIPGKLNNLKYPADEAEAIQFLVMFQGLSAELAFRFKRLFKKSRLSNAELIDFARAVGRPDERLVYAFIRFEPSITGAELQAQGYQGQELGKEMDRRETEIFKRLM